MSEEKCQKRSVRRGEVSDEEEVPEEEEAVPEEEVSEVTVLLGVHFT